MSTYFDLHVCRANLRKILGYDYNWKCADCNADCRAEVPRWASWNLGVFLCIRCAGIHRKLGFSEVKTIDLDMWTHEQVACLELMGNGYARRVYEDNLPKNFRRPQTDSSLEAFIRAKYEQKKYIAKGWVPPPAPPPAIASETAAAQEISNESVGDNLSLHGRLEKLKKIFPEYVLNARKSATEQAEKIPSDNYDDVANVDPTAKYRNPELPPGYIFKHRKPEIEPYEEDTKIINGVRCRFLHLLIDSGIFNSDYDSDSDIEISSCDELSFSDKEEAEQRGCPKRKCKMTNQRQKYPKINSSSTSTGKSHTVVGIDDEKSGKSDSHVDLDNMSEDNESDPHISMSSTSSSAQKPLPTESPLLIGYNTVPAKRTIRTLYRELVNSSDDDLENMTEDEEPYIVMSPSQEPLPLSEEPVVSEPPENHPPQMNEGGNTTPKRVPRLLQRLRL